MKKEQGEKTEEEWNNKRETLLLRVENQFASKKKCAT